jgi:Pyridoxamine 5'-phosphate oxidase
VSEETGPSDEARRKLVPDELDAHIEANVRTFLVTHRKDGSPTCHPMARFYADRRYYMNMYASSVKHKNLERHPQVAVLVTNSSDTKDLKAVLVRGNARLLSIDETLADDAPAGVVLARGIGMEGVRRVEDAPEKFVGEDPDDWLKRAAVMVERIRDRVRVIWEVVPEHVDWLEDVREVPDAP